MKVEVRMRTSRVFIGIASVTMCFSLMGQAHGEQASGGSSNAGKSCTVKSGPNTGKTGTITIEEGTNSEWCEGTWGGIECTSGGTSTGKCSVAAVATGGTRLPGLALADKQLLQAYATATSPGAGTDALKTWAQRYNAKVVSQSGSALTLSVAGKTLVFDGNLKGLATVRR